MREPGQANERLFKCFAIFLSSRSGQSRENRQNSGQEMCAGVCSERARATEETAQVRSRRTVSERQEQPAAAAAATQSQKKVDPNLVAVGLL